MEAEFNDEVNHPARAGIPINFLFGFVSRKSEKTSRTIDLLKFSLKSVHWIDLLKFSLKSVHWTVSCFSCTVSD